MADSVTITSTPIITPKYIQATVIKVSIAWVADDTLATVTTTDIPASIMNSLVGKKCILGTTAPDDTTAPTADYDIEILDALGVDIFGGALNDRSATANEQAIPLLATGWYGPRLVADQLSFKLSNNSVNEAAGECVLYFEL